MKIKTKVWEEDARMTSIVKKKIEEIKANLGREDFTLKEYVIERKKDPKRDYSPKENYYFNNLINSSDD